MPTEPWSLVYRQMAARRIHAIDVAGVVAAICVFASPAAGQTIRGLLVESDTDRTVQLGTVVMARQNGDTVAVALSNEDGFFSLTAPEGGTYSIFARAPGYALSGRGPYELEVDELMVVEVPMTLAPIPIEGVEVRTTPLVITDDALVANGFYDRMRQGKGQFLTPYDLANSMAKYTPLLFRELDHVFPQYGASPWLTWVRLWSPFVSTCVPHVYVDNVWANRPGFLPDGIGLDDVVPRKTIKAVELYWGFETPFRYSRGSLCGAILFWTNR